MVTLCRAHSVAEGRIPTMWHHIVMLPWAAKIIGVLAVVGLAIYGWFKRPKTPPQKIRVLNRFRGIFPQWTLRRQVRVIEHTFDSEIAEAKRQKDWDGVQAIEGNASDECAEYWDALAELRSERLVKKASKRGILTEGLEWQIGNYGERYLTHTSETKLRRAVIDDVRKDWEFRLKIIGALTGLVGALIGLAAFLTHSKK